MQLVNSNWTVEPITTLPAMSFTTTTNGIASYGHSSRCGSTTDWVGLGTLADAGVAAASTAPSRTGARRRSRGRIAHLLDGRGNTGDANPRDAGGQSDSTMCSAAE